MRQVCPRLPQAGANEPKACGIIAEPRRTVAMKLEMAAPSFGRDGEPLAVAVDG